MLFVIFCDLAIITLSIVYGSAKNHIFPN